MTSAHMTTLTESPRQARARALDERDAEVVRRYFEGETGHAIARAVGLSHVYVYRILRAAGVSVRPTGRRTKEGR